MWTLEPQLRFESWFIFILAALPWVTYSLLYQCLARGQHHACVSMVGTAIEHLQCTNQGSQSVTCINSINTTALSDESWCPRLTQQEPLKS